MIRRPPRSTRTTHSFPTQRSSDLSKSRDVPTRRVKSRDRLARLRSHRLTGQRTGGAGRPHRRFRLPKTMAARTIGEQIHPEHSTHPEIGLRLPPLHDPPSFLIGMSTHSNVKRIDLPGRAVKTALYPPTFQSAADTQYQTMRSGMQPFRYPPSEAVRAASGDRKSTRLNSSH